MPDLISTGVALFLSWLFAQAALHKFRAPEGYRQLIAVYLETDTVSRATVWLIACVELALALMLLLPVSRHAGLAGSALMLLGYSGLMALQLLRGRKNIQCGCAGPASTTTITPALVARNIICVLLALWAMVPAMAAATSVLSMGLSIFIAVFSILIYLSSEQMISNAQQMAGGH